MNIEKICNEEKILLIEFLQKNLVGKIDSSANVNPCHLAEGIITLLDFNKPLKERNTKRINGVIDSFNKMIDDIDLDMDTELAQLGKDETLLKNFIRGQKTACEKMRETLKTI